MADHKPRILIADDEETVADSTAVLLEEEGFVCDTAQDGESALAVFASHDYDLLVTDWNMNGNKDLELVRSARSINPRVPIILITGYPELPAVVAKYGVSISAHLIKPFDIAELLTTVRSALKPEQRPEASA